MAFHWYQIAANAEGDTLKLTEMLAKGEGTTKNTAEAIHLLISMPDNETAQLQLAEVYIFYDTTTPDRYEKARHILEPLHDREKPHTIDTQLPTIWDCYTFLGWEYNGTTGPHSTT